VATNKEKMKKYIEKMKEFFSKIRSSNTSNISISSKEKINLLESLSNLLNSGIPLINSFKIIMYQTRDKKMKILVKEMIEKLNK
jgi:type II secretory pathway component PulF